MKRELVIVVTIFAFIGKVFVLLLAMSGIYYCVFSASAAAQDIEVEGTVENVDIDLGASREASRTGTYCFHLRIFSNVIR